MKSNYFLRHALVLSVALMAALLTPVAMATDQLVIYSGRSDKFVKPVVEAFTEKTGIDVLIHNGKSTALLNKIRVEGARTQADLYLSNDAGNLQMGADLGLFTAIPDQIISVIPTNMKAVDNTWVGLSARARVLVVNTEAKDTAWIKSVFDLADPRLKDELGITHSANESYIAGVTVYMAVAGKEKTKAWLEGMKNNVGSRVYNKHSKTVNAVANGQKTVGLVNHYYVTRHLDKNPKAPIKLVLPDQGDNGMGVAWNVAGVAVSKYTKNSQQAQQLVEFFVSAEGQEIFAKVNNEYPTRPGIAASAKVPAAGSYKVADVPMAALGSNRNATIDLIEAVGMP